MSTPFANILHRDAIRALVDGRTFDRGQAYFAERRVEGLARREGSLSATVRGTANYLVRIWVKDSALAYSCTCPVGSEDKAFCKHGVAVALTWLERGASAPPLAPSLAMAELAPLRVELARLDRTALVDLVLRCAAEDPRVLDLVRRATRER